MNALNEAIEIEISTNPTLSSSQQTIVDLHSIINLVNVLHGCIELLCAEGGAGLENVQAQLYQFSKDINDAATLCARCHVVLITTGSNAIRSGSITSLGSRTATGPWAVLHILDSRTRSSLTLAATKGPSQARRAGRTSDDVFPD